MLSTRLQELGITLPAMAGPFGAYVPAKRVGGFIYVAGQLPMRDKKLVATGRVPSVCSIEQGCEAARQCVINALSAVSAVEGSVDAIAGIVRVGVFVNSDASFTAQPTIANAASELLEQLLGPAGRHVRAAVGVAALPLDAAVEIEFLFIAR